MQREGWSALRQVLREWGIEEPNHLTTWLRGQGFPGTSPGNHISQEFIMGEASHVDARVALLEGVYVQLAIHMGRHPTGRRETAGVDWGQLDQFQVDNLFLTRVPMLKSCAHFLSGRLREAFQVALRERFRAKLMGDEDGQVRGLVPMMFDRLARDLLAVRVGSQGR